MSDKRNIAIIATLDTKGREASFMSGLLKSWGFGATLLDVGTSAAAAPPDVSHEEIAGRAGWRLPDLVRAPRDRIMEEMGKGAAHCLLDLYRTGRIDGVIAIGGNQGSAMAATAMRALPFGFPKYLVSTVASGNIRPYVGCKDIAMVFSVGDFLGGPNVLTRDVLANAVAAVAGMAGRRERQAPETGKRTVGLTALGNTEEAAAHAVGLLRDEGFEVVPFHASGAGGSAMEELIDAGMIQGVLDLTPHELTEEVVGLGAYVPVRPGRLLAAGAKGIPQVVSTGCMEYVAFGPRSSIPPALRRRKTYMHNPYNANVSVSRAEMALVARTMAERLNAAVGPVAVMVPLLGWSVYGAKGGPLHDEGAYALFLRTLKRHLSAAVRLEEIEARIGERRFVERCVEQLREFMRVGGNPRYL